VQKNERKNKQVRKQYTRTYLTTVCSAITRVSLRRIGYNATDEYVNAVCIMRTFAYAWLLGDFCDKGECAWLDD
jgi:hypothetical protein